MLRRGAALALVPLALFGCSGGSDEPPTAADFSGFLAESFIASDPPMPEQESRCLADAVVGAIGVQPLVDARVDPIDLAATDDFASLGVVVPGDAAAGMTAGIQDCGVVPFAESVFFDGMAAESGVPVSDETRRCVAAAIDDQAFALAMAASMLDQANIGSLIQAAVPGFAACPAGLVELVTASVQTALGAPLSTASQSCIEQFVLADPGGTAASFTSIEDGEALGMRLGATCPITA